MEIVAASYPIIVWKSFHLNSIPETRAQERFMFYALFISMFIHSIITRLVSILTMRLVTWIWDFSAFRWTSEHRLSYSRESCWTRDKPKFNGFHFVKIGFSTRVHIGKSLCNVYKAKRRTKSTVELLFCKAWQTAILYTAKKFLMFKTLELSWLFP